MNNRIIDLRVIINYHQIKMSDFNTVIDLGTDNIRINVFNNSAQSIFLSQIKNNNNSETSLSRLI